MKTLAKTIGLTMVMLAVISFSTFAGDGKKKKKAKSKKKTQMVYQAAINEHYDNTIAIHFQKPSDQKVSITIRDQKGKILKYEVIRKHDLVVKKYVLDKFPKGTYQVEVRNGNEVLTKEITVEGKSTK
ncbi:MAG: T9SS type A sorting domain-containing protein [Flammeovirgaceae bacterium]